MLVETAATGVNFIEIYQRSGVYNVPFPFTPGSEAAGTVPEGVDLETPGALPLQGCTAHYLANEKRQLSLDAGAEESFGYDDFAGRIRDLTHGAGVAIAYDGVGKTTFDQSLDSLSVRGTLVLFGGASGQVPPFDLQRLNTAGSAFITRPTIAHYMLTADERAWRYRDLFDALEEGKLNVRIGERFALADAGKAHEALAGRGTTGKLILTP